MNSDNASKQIEQIVERMNEQKQRDAWTRSTRSIPTNGMTASSSVGSHAYPQEAQALIEAYEEAKRRGEPSYRLSALHNAVSDAMRRYQMESYKDLDAKLAGLLQGQGIPMKASVPTPPTPPTPPTTPSIPANPFILGTPESLLYSELMVLERAKQDTMRTAAEAERRRDEWGANARNSYAECAALKERQEALRSAILKITGKDAI